MSDMHRLSRDGYLADMRVFLEVVRQQSFVAAGRQLRLPQSSVSRRIMALEARLGVRLLNRIPRSLSLTEAGRRWHEHAQRILADLADAEADLANTQGSPRGHLRVTAPVSFGRLHLAPVVMAFLGRHPDVSVELTLDDGYADLIRDGYDLAIRIGALADSRLVARRITSNRRRLVAAPSYLARRGTPVRPSDLPAHDCLEFTPLATGDVWRFDGPDGASESVRVAGRLRSNNAEVLIRAAREGLGLGLPADFLSTADLAAGTLVEVMTGWRPTATDVHAVWANRSFTPAKLSAFVGFLAEAFREPPWHTRDRTVQTAGGMPSVISMEQRPR